MKNLKGISLIVLVITIIVILIISGAVILTISQSNPISKATEASFKARLNEYASELTMYISREQVNNPTTFNIDNVNANTSAEVSGILTSITSSDSKNFKIIKGKLIYSGNDSNEYIWAKELSLPNEYITPLVSFNAKGISSLAGFNDINVPITWTGTPTLVTDGVQTNSGVYGIYDYDTSNFDEISFCYTFSVQNYSAWQDIINIGYITGVSGFQSLKLEWAEASGYLRLYGIGETVVSSNRIVVNPAKIGSGGWYITNGIQLSKKYNLILTVSKTQGARMYLNGFLVMYATQPSGQVGYNPQRYTGIIKNSFNLRIDTNQTSLNCVHNSLRIWNKALSYGQVQDEYLKDKNDFGII